MESTWSHPIITQGQPVVIRKLNVTGLKAVMRKQKDVGADPTDKAANLEVFSVMAFHTLRRSLPNLTQQAVDDNLEVADLETLSTAILAANPELRQKAGADFPIRAEG